MRVTDMLIYLFERLPKKHHNRVKAFYLENGLIDDCKYMLEFAEGFNWHEEDSLPCKSVTEAITYIKASACE